MSDVASTDHQVDGTPGGPMATGPVDGRGARRQRNVNAVLDVVLEMFAEEALFPTMEQAAARSGLSLRSLYRYFADPGELLEAAIGRSRERGRELSKLHDIGQGPFDRRVKDFVDMRVDLYEAVGPVYRATMANASRHPRVSAEQATNRDGRRRQFELQFEPELGDMTSVDRDNAVAAGDVLTQMESIDYLRHHRGLPVDRTKAALISALRSLLR